MLTRADAPNGFGGSCDDSIGDIREQEAAPLVEPTDTTMAPSSTREWVPPARHASGHTHSWLRCWSVGSLAIVVASFVLLINA
jgi:hypothetical protein